MIGKDGRIAYKLVGPITPDNIETTLKPAIAKALGRPNSHPGSQDGLEVLMLLGARSRPTASCSSAMHFAAVPLAQCAQRIRAALLRRRGEGRRADREGHQSGVAHAHQGGDAARRAAPDHLRD